MKLKGVWKERVLHSFSSKMDANAPAGSVVLDGSGNLYGVGQYGGRLALAQCMKSLRKSAFQIPTVEASRFALIELIALASNPLRGKSGLYGSDSPALIHSSSFARKSQDDSPVPQFRQLRRVLILHSRKSTQCNIPADNDMSNLRSLFRAYFSVRRGVTKPCPPRESAKK